MTAVRRAWTIAPLLLILLVIVTATVGCASAGSSDEPAARALPGADPGHGTARTPEWAAIVDELDAPIDDTDATPCHRGEPACFDAVIGEMEARLNELGCDHRAPFAFTYLLMTRGVARAVPNFGDPPLLSVIDARFARLYFDAVDNWDAGRIDDVPAAWQIAFSTAEGGNASAAADLVLGMNAHISRDLAYTVASAIAGGDATAETDDYRQINDVIGEVQSDVLKGATERFDPNLFLLGRDLGGDSAPDPVELIARWRSRAFEQGVQLTLAESDAERRAAEAEIESTSAAAAGLIVAADRSQASGALDGVDAIEALMPLPPVERDEYCSARLDG